MKSMAETWFEQDEPRWFERSDVFHGSGILLDKKTKVLVTSDGKKIDSFKLADVPNLFKVLQATGNSCDMSSAGILAMENSEGTATFTGSVDVYDRSKLVFEIVRIGGFNLFATDPAAASAQYFIITGVQGLTGEGIESSETSSAVLISSGLPFTAPADCKYDAAAAARFRKTFLG
ncbi:MAG: hypothetical protein FGM15_03400 [Chthoniobacterales bacterium]|nr:hypothetical protein [Chthoniobacterales bacterium]